MQKSTEKHGIKRICNDIFTYLANFQNKMTFFHKYS